ncbi:MAG: L-2-hydroxyglutarate oxidase [Halomonas sp.]|nr:L-2-hydroxyglutarate oxidase [Halomonas sp.]MDN6297497.1 L-2-hydroxyglutarate oxidase [Halomonas sp.]MDN6314653.1 L-2-hydroxyglutarate oxidase [Halomonas sp.]MDN6335777.1 L-2-hydroxyglutarate oxidase [Halomonas sp.]
MYDVIVIGGGIVGLSTALKLKQAYPDRRMVVLEKEQGPARHQSGHNSGVIHAGVYYAPGSLKARFCLEGNRATQTFCERHGIAYRRCGKILVAANQAEVSGLGRLGERIGQNGLESRWLSAGELAEREPNVRGAAGILVSASGIVDYAEVARAMAAEFARLGGEIRYQVQVSGLEERNTEVVANTTAGDISARYMVSCAGLYADRVIRLLGRNPGFTICPFRGEYFALPSAKNDIVKHLIYPVPDPSMPFLGVHLTPMIDGRITVGPNAVLALGREGYRWRDVAAKDLWEMAAHAGVRRMLSRYARPGLWELKNSLYKRGYLARVQAYCPEIALEDLTPYPAGVRAQAVADDGGLLGDFVFVNTKRTVNVGNAPSPAATSALPIGAHIVEQIKARLAG